MNLYFLTIFPLTCLKFPIRKYNFTITMLFTEFPTSFITFSRNPIVNSVTMPLIIIKLPFICPSIWPLIDSLSMHCILPPFPGIFSFIIANINPLIKLYNFKKKTFPSILLFCHSPSYVDPSLHSYFPIPFFFPATYYPLYLLQSLHISSPYPSSTSFLQSPSSETPL